jgi:benzaldehyde dehydrogenase (NAD)
MATGRHLVQESIAEEYTAVLTERVEELPVGDRSARRWRWAR